MAPNGETEEISFKLMLTDSADVHMKAHWGTSSSYDDYKSKDFYITNKAEIKMIINGQEEPPKVNTENEIESTLAPTTPSEPVSFYPIGRTVAQGSADPSCG